MSELVSTFEGNSFVRISHEPMDDDRIRQIAPSVFSEAAHSSRSERYGYVNTAALLGAMRSAGFEVFAAAQTFTRKADRAPFTRHLLRLRHPAQILDTEAEEIIFVNSHDGSSRLQVLIGLLRFACMNGLVCGQGTVDIKLPHTRSAVDGIVEKMVTLSETFAQVRERRDVMRSTELSASEQLRFCERALAVRYSVGAPITAKQVNEARRHEDIGSSLWLTFQRAQENLMKGGIQGSSPGKRRFVRTRAIRAVGATVSLNRDLWNLADQTQQELAAA